jgi:hypothetical protein
MRLAIIALVACSLLAGTAVAQTADPLPADPHPTLGAMNPAVTDANAAKTICVPNWDLPPIRPPGSYTNKLKASQLPPGTNLRLYEEDHVQAISNGGDPRNPANLRPQYWTGPSGARTKDHQVEGVVHRAICKTHTMTIAQGQAFTAAWIAAHHPYPLMPSGH